MSFHTGLFRSLLALAILSRGFSCAAEEVRVGGSNVMLEMFRPAMIELAERHGITPKIFTRLTSSIGITAVAEDQLDLAFSTRLLTEADRALNPDVRWEEKRIGTQAMVLGVSRDVVDGGIKSLSREQVISIYESRVKNWKELGGPDQVIKFYKPERDKGLWDMFATWLYEDMRKAPLGKEHETIKTGEEAAFAVEFNAGSIAPMPAIRADRKRVYPIAIDTPNGPILPTRESIRDLTWPMSRPLLIIAGRRPTEDLRRVFEFMLSKEGQRFVTQAEHMTRAESGLEDEAMPTAAPEKKE